MSNPRTMSRTNLANNETINNRIIETSTWKDFLALIKVGIVNSNLITTFTGIWLAIYFTDKSFFNELNTVFITLIGSALIMAGSCCINNYFDRDIDHLMERTKGRPTVTGRVKPGKVALLGLIFIAFGLFFITFTSLTALLIGLIGVVSYVVIYTMWSKRVHVSNTIVGSISGAVPPLIGWAAVDPNLDIMAWVLFLIMFAWQPPHFYALAMRRAEEYRAAKIPMLPVIKGFATTKKHIFFWILFLLPLPFFMAELGIAFIVLATILNIGWIVTGIYGYKFKDDMKWAKLMFIYSLQYLTIMFVSMVIFTFIPF